MHTTILGAALLLCLACAPEEQERSPASEPSAEVKAPEPLPLERLVRVPDGLAASLAEPNGISALDSPNAPRAGLPLAEPGRLQPSVSVDSRRHERLGPGSEVESTRYGAGVKVSSGKRGESPAISLEGAVREDLYDQAPDDPERDTSVGVRIEVPWPVDKGPARNGDEE